MNRSKSGFALFVALLSWGFNLDVPAHAQKHAFFVNSPSQNILLYGQVDSLTTRLEAMGLKVSSSSPVVVSSVQPRSAAARANLCAGDKILSTSESGTNLRLTIERNGVQYQTLIQNTPTNVNGMPANAKGATNDSGISKDSDASTLFDARTIARDGASGVDQGHNPNCWFECSLAAVANLPRGQQAIANMIACDHSDMIVTFQDERKPFRVSTTDIATARLRNKALWASVMECAEIKRFPDNDPEYSPAIDKPKIIRGLEMLTGRQVFHGRPDQYSVSDLAALIQKCITRHQPVVVASKSPGERGSVPDLVSSNHGYSILNYEPANGMVTLRNPHGREKATGGEGVKYMADGVMQMDIPTLQTYYRFIAWTEDF